MFDAFKDLLRSKLCWHNRPGVQITSIDLYTQSNYLIRRLAAMVFNMGNYMNFANKTAHEFFSMHENLKMIATSCNACTTSYCVNT